MADKILCSCFLRSAEYFADAVQDLRGEIIAAKDMDHSALIVYFETHKSEDGPTRPRCFGCLGNIRNEIIEQGLRAPDEKVSMALLMRHPVDFDKIKEDMIRDGWKPVF